LPHFYFRHIIFAIAAGAIDILPIRHIIDFRLMPDLSARYAPPLPPFSPAADAIFAI
jgi:hypothetical protein